jgi:hypothetical protein
VVPEKTTVSELATLYIDLWRKNCGSWAETKLDYEDWDLSTALHFLDACYTRDELAKFAERLN